MKILHITPAYYPATYWGGPTFSAYHLNNALAKMLTTDMVGPEVSDWLTVQHKQKEREYVNG